MFVNSGIKVPLGLANVPLWAAITLVFINHIGGEARRDLILVFENMTRFESFENRLELDTVEDFIDIFNFLLKDFFTASNERKFPVHGFGGLLLRKSFRLKFAFNTTFDFKDKLLRKTNFLESFDDFTSSFFVKVLRANTFRSVKQAAHSRSFVSKRSVRTVWSL